jgi:hypothetical protein
MHPNNSLCFALLNVQSINNKSATIHSLISDNSIDILALTETWHISATDLPLRRAAPGGYKIVDAPRPGYSADSGSNHGGIAVVFRDIFVLRTIALPVIRRHLNSSSAMPALCFANLF